LSTKRDESNKTSRFAPLKWKIINDLHNKVPDIWYLAIQTLNPEEEKRGLTDVSSGGGSNERFFYLENEKIY
jgi:hypothetical protein